MRQTWILIIIFILFVFGHYNLVLLIGYTKLMLWFVGKAFLSTILFKIKVDLWNETNLYSHNNLYFSYDCALQLCPPYWVHDIDALDLQEKFFLLFPLYSKFIREMRQTLILVIISTPFVLGSIIMFSSLGHTILMLWFSRESFFFHHFLYN